MAQATIRWTGVAQMQTNCTVYADKVNDAIHAVANYFKPVLETDAKQNAPWTDRTGNARQALYSDVMDLAQDVVMLFLAHGMNYGLFLEVRWSAKYAVIWPTIRANLNDIAAMLQGMFQ